MCGLQPEALSIKENVVRPNTEFMKAGLRVRACAVARVVGVQLPPFADAASWRASHTDITHWQGITVISTAGDLGVSDGVNCSTFYPDFPSSSPYTTSLGATAVARLGIADICSSTMYAAGCGC